MARTLPLVLGFVVAGLVGALTGRLFLVDDRPSPAPEPSRTESDPRIGELARLVASIDARLDLLEDNAGTAPASGAPRPVAGTVDTPPELVATLTTDVPDALEERVREVIEEEQKNRREAMGRRFSEQAIAREKALLDSLTEEQGLTPHQREEMEKILARRREAIGEFFRTMFSGDRDGDAPDFSAIRKKLDDVRAESNTELENLLSPSQYEAFVEQDPQQRMGPMGFGGGRGRGR